MKCRACAIAAVNAATGQYEAGCQSCRARALAHAPEFFDACTTDAITPGYRSRLQQAFGKNWKSGHDAVRAWKSKIDAAVKARI